MPPGAAVHDERKRVEPRAQEDRDASRLSSTTAIANTIRRAGRQSGSVLDVRERITQMIRDGLSARQIYLDGQDEGRLVVANNLADVLYAAQFTGLGRIAVIEESNCHTLFRVTDCVGCRSGSEFGCNYVAGFLSGALLATSRFVEVEVEIASRGEFPARTCVYRAELRRRS